jgi:ssDNA-binding Zn-finger/Zn-ribbon topoisomerase 1
MVNFRYVTNRTLLDRAGNEKGRIAVLVRNDSSEAEVRYTCPECRFSEQTRKPWKRPFSLKCGKCGFLIRISKLRDEIKREKKAERA